MYVQPLEGSLGAGSLSAPAGSGGGEGTLQGFTLSGAFAGDNIARLVPPWPNAGAEGPADGNGTSYGTPGSMQGLYGTLIGMLQQLMQMLQSLTGYGGGTQYGSGGCSSPYGDEQYFQNASGGSDGDPHLSFDGSRWNSMVSQPDLLDSDSFPGGFKISTQVTAPDAKGVTRNQSATISMNGGATTVSMNNAGQPSITSYGRSIAIAPGQTVQLGNGESATYHPDGSLSVVAQNGAGGQIATTLTRKGAGVNVDVTAHDVDLGGALVDGPQRQSGSGTLGAPVSSPGGGTISGPIIGAPPLPPISQPVIGPIAQPIPEPIRDAFPIVPPGRMHPEA